MKKILQEYIDKKLITCRKHPTKDLYIYNYTPECCFTKAWDEITLQCRGLILDGDGRVVARPFKKFFNYGELESNKKYLDQEPEYIMEKVDGSMGVLFWHKGEWDIATRGSFESEQAIEARKMLKDYDLKWLNSGFTFIVEIVYPENRVVVNYSEDESGLYLLGMVCLDESLGIKSSYEDILNVASRTRFKVPKQLKYNSLKELLEFMKVPKENFEGYVITYKDGTKLKVKYEQYCILHKIVTGLTEHKVWEALAANSEKELMSMLPDEFYKWTEDVIKDFKLAYYVIAATVAGDWQDLRHLTNRKEFAEQAKTKKYPAMLFRNFDNREYESLIWKILEP